MISYFSLVCASYLLLKEHSVNIKELHEINITVELKKLHVTVIDKKQTTVYKTDIDVDEFRHLVFYNKPNLIITFATRAITLTKTQRLILKTIELSKL